MARLTQPRAIFVLSLDFELYWGWLDVCDLDSLKPRLMNVRPTVRRLLKLFERYEIHATWATVGFLFCQNQDQLMRALPSVKPDYREDVLSPYGHLACVGENEEDDPYHYAPSLIQAILDTPHQEIGTHTFSHYYGLEDGQTLASFKSDLEAAIEIAKRRNVELRSLVFPRNQVNPEYLQACAEVGIHAYRGAGDHWIYRERKRGAESRFRRAIRLLDAYLNLSGHHTLDYGKAVQNYPFNIAASRFLRPYSARARWLEPMRLSRICRGLEFAAKKRRIYHLWLHPEDLAVNPERNLHFLEQVLGFYKALRNSEAMESMNMREVASLMAGSADGFLNRNEPAYV